MPLKANLYEFLKNETVSTWNSCIDQVSGFQAIGLALKQQHKTTTSQKFSSKEQQKTQKKWHTFLNSEITTHIAVRTDNRGAGGIKDPNFTPIYIYI